MKEIVEKTELSKGAFYHYFSSKEELFKEIVNLFFSFGNIDYTAFSQESLYIFFHEYMEQLRISFKKINEFAGGKEQGKISFNFFFIMFEAMNKFPDFLFTELEQHKNDVKEWQKIIRIARKKGEINSSSSDEQIAELFLYCNDGVFILYINNNKNTSFADELLNIYNTIYDGLKT